MPSAPIAQADAVRSSQEVFIDVGGERLERIAQENREALAPNESLV